MLEYFKQVKRQALSNLEGKTFPAWEGSRPCFATALKQKAQREGVALIAEYKRASPSLGDINLDTTVEEAATSYAAGGAACMSVLTEETKFKGSLAFLSRAHAAVPSGLPLLRKDFLFHPLQIYETAQTPAAALLLIVALLPGVQALRELCDLTEQLGMQAVVEVFERDELVRAREAGARVIQVNARNLSDMSMDRNRALALARNERHATGFADEIWIAASGIENSAQLHESKEAGYDAVLVGTSLMRRGTPSESLAALLRRQ